MVLLMNLKILNINKKILIKRMSYIEILENIEKNNIPLLDDIKNLLLMRLFEIALTFKSIPKPQYFPYILSLLNNKTIKIGNNEVNTVLYNFNKDDGYILYKLIKNIDAKKVLEIGMNYGLASVFILQSLKYFYETNNDEEKLYYKLTSIDPDQEKKWGNIGIDHLKKMKLIYNHKLIEEKAYLVLPDMINRKKIFDIIFINGYNKLDKITMYMFYSEIIVKVGGYIVINNITNIGINKIIRYVEKNYDTLKKIKMDNKTMAIFMKIKNKENI